MPDFQLQPAAVTFAGLPASTSNDLATLTAPVAIIGIGGMYPYEPGAITSQSDPARQALREASQRWAPFLGHEDFDFGGPLLGDPPLPVVDVGDVVMTPGDHAANSIAAQAAISAIRARGAVPIVLGGDDSVPIPVIRGLSESSDICIVQLDAHLDWRHERDGQVEGLSSPMRRASELPWVTKMAQIGLRSAGGSRGNDYADARAFGSVLIGADELHQQGVDAALANIPAAAGYYIAFDADALDPAIAPGVLADTPGGLTYYEASNLLRGVARLGPIVGYNIVEVVPDRDRDALTSRLAARLTLNLIGEMARQQFAAR